MAVLDGPLIRMVATNTLSTRSPLTVDISNVALIFANTVLACSQGGATPSRSGFGERAAAARLKRDSSPAGQRRARDYPAGAAMAPRPNDSQLL